MPLEIHICRSWWRFLQLGLYSRKVNESYISCSLPYEVRCKRLFSLNGVGSSSAMWSCPIEALNVLPQLFLFDLHIKYTVLFSAARRSWHPTARWLRLLVSG